MLDVGSVPDFASEPLGPHSRGDNRASLPGGRCRRQRRARGYLDHGDAPRHPGTTPRAAVCAAVRLGRDTLRRGAGGGLKEVFGEDARIPTTSQTRLVMQLLAGFCAVGILSIPPHIEEVIYCRRKYRLHENSPFCESSLSIGSPRLMGTKFSSHDWQGRSSTSRIPTVIYSRIDRDGRSESWIGAGTSSVLRRSNRRG